MLFPRDANTFKTLKSQFFIFLLLHLKWQMGIRFYSGPYGRYFKDTAERRV